MNFVRSKKNLGQHFLHDQNIARKIVDSLGNSATNVLEVGPGMGVLTRFLLQQKDIQLHVVEIDPESVIYLKHHYPELEGRIHEADFLHYDLRSVIQEEFSIIGNFPYNISSQIFFRILELKQQIPEVVGMVQKEVAERIASGNGTKSYGILSVLLQAFYDIEYLFTVPEQVFSPPPKVKSAVIRLKRNERKKLPCSEKMFFSVVKMAFNQRRKMLRKSLASYNTNLPEKFSTKRPEQLSVESFIELACVIENREKL